MILDAALLGEVIFASEWGEIGDEDPPRDAWFREAESGTLVLPDVEKLSRAAQAHLLRVLGIGSATAASRRLTPAAWAALERYALPGNVAELRSMLEHALALAEGGAIDVVHLPAAVTGALRH